MIDLSKPVIWTSKGNLNEDDLDKFVEWEEHEGATVCIVGARLKSTGEIVKRGVYVRAAPNTSLGIAAPFA